MPQPRAVPARRKPGVVEGLWRLLPRFVGAAFAPILLWLLGILALALPTQTADLLAVGGPGQLALFYIGVFVWGLTCWFWIRWALNLEPTRPPEFTPALLALFRRAYPEDKDRRPGPWRRRVFVSTAGARLRRLLARLPLYTAGAVAMIQVLRSAAGRPGREYWAWILYNLLGAAIVTLLLWLFAEYRHHPRVFAFLRADQGRPPTVAGEDGLRRPLGWRACAERLPFGRHSYLVWLLAFLVLALAFAFDQGRIATALGAPAAAFLAAAAAGGTLSFIVVMAERGFGLPGLVLLLAWLWLGGELTNNHPVRTLEAASPSRPAPERTEAHLTRRPDRRPRLQDALDAWRSTCPPEAERDRPRLLIVATAGGASRAALFTARALRRLEMRLRAEPGADGVAMLPGTLRRALFAISGVSGGSLGATAWVASLPPAGCAAPVEAPEQAQQRWDRLRGMLAEIFLAPPIARYLTTDLLARLAFHDLPDRAAALEQAWERAWARHWRDAGLPTAAAGLDDSFLGLWLNGVPPAAVPGPSVEARVAWPLLGRLPLLLLNGTHAGTGLPIVTAPVQINQDHFPQALDLLHLIGRDIRLSTAISSSARFPYITPGGTLIGRRGDQPLGQVLDGGYVENFGADTLRDLIAGIRAWSKQGHEPLIAVLQISSDPSMRQVAIPRCHDRPEQPLPLPGSRDVSPALDDALSPLLTVAEVRGARGLRSASDLARQMCAFSAAGEASESFYAHFALCNDDDVPGLGAPRDVIGLNWALTDAVARYLAPSGRDEAERRTEAMDACGNREELDRLARWFASPARPRAPAGAAPAPPERQ